MPFLNISITEDAVSVKDPSLGIEKTCLLTELPVAALVDISSLMYGKAYPLNKICVAKQVFVRPTQAVMSWLYEKNRKTAKYRSRELAPI